MLKRLKQFWNWVYRVINWIFGGKQADVFLVILVTFWIGVLVHFYVPQAKMEPFIRLSSAFLETLGLVVVVIGILNMRVLFGLPGVRQMLRDKWRRFPKFKNEDRFKTSGAKAELTGISAKVGKLKAIASFPDRMSALRLEVWGLLMIFAGIILAVDSEDIARLLS
ncbi:MAG: hypothetical protein R3354_08130 [Thiohalomonadales bacterium]|nr:hypothetical protein [Thiohalomonadales bacterium]